MGKRTGNPRGRPIGAANKASVAREQAIAASGLTPLDYMLDTMRDENQPVNIRLSAAKDAAQYVHPKLSAVTLKGDDNNPLRTVSMSLEAFEATAREIAAEV